MSNLQIILNNKFSTNFNPQIKRNHLTSHPSKPKGSMYGIFPYIWLISMVNVSKYTSPMDPMGNMVPSIHMVPSIRVVTPLSLMPVRLFYPLINEGFKILEEGYVARSSDIDLACRCLEKGWWEGHAFSIAYRKWW